MASQLKKRPRLQCPRTERATSSTGAAASVLALCSILAEPYGARRRRTRVGNRVGTAPENDDRPLPDSARGPVAALVLGLCGTEVQLVRGTYEPRQQNKSSHVPIRLWQSETWTV
jgi:hypothetical protein